MDSWLVYISFIYIQGMGEEALQAGGGRKRGGSGGGGAIST